MRCGLFALASVLVACGPNEPDVVTGGFDESVVDRLVNQGARVRVADLDGDGTVEIIGSFGITGAVIVYAQPEGDLTEPWERIPISGLLALSANDVAVADIDGDGDMDVVGTSRAQRNQPNTSAGELTWWENPGELRGIWKTHPVTGPTLFGPTSLETGDIDGDGRVDLIVATQSVLVEEVPQGGGLYWFANGDGGAFTGPIAIDSVIAADEIRAADIDADGKLDVIAVSSAMLQLTYFRNTSTATSVGRFIRYTVETGPRYSAVQVGNLDGDAALEVVTAAVDLGTGSSTLSVTIHSLPSLLGNPWPTRTVEADLRSDELEQPAGPHIAIGDVDGDQTNDLIVSTSAPGDLRVYFDRGTEFEPCVVRGGYQGISSVTTGDIDGDNVVDLVTNTNGFGARDRVAWWRNTGPCR